jgi:hypothetical protein
MLSKKRVSGDLQKENVSSMPTFLYEDLESAFLANIGNWKKLKRQDNKDIYKCSECDCKLEAEKKGSNFRINLKSGPSGEQHTWFDSAHLAPFQHDPEFIEGSAI